MTAPAASPGAEALAGPLREVVGRALGAEVTVTGLRRLSGGASRETWSFDAGTPTGVRPLILRRDSPTRVPQRGFVQEAAAIGAVDGRGVPVPTILLHEEDPAALGAPFLIMDRLEGETLGRRIVSHPDLAGARAVLVRHCGEALARIHGVGPPEVPDVPAGPDPLAVLREQLDSAGTASPAFELGLRWLAANRPPATRRTLVHGDFRVGNLMVGPEGLRAVLDWELSHVGDPWEDLGWAAVRAWRFGSALPVGGVGSREDFFAAYEAVAGIAVDRPAVFWWEVLGTLRWGVNCLSFARRHLSGETRSVELAAIGRRACEQEYDLLRMLAPAGVGAR